MLCRRPRTTCQPESQRCRISSSGRQCTSLVIRVQESTPDRSGAGGPALQCQPVFRGWRIRPPQMGSERGDSEREGKMGYPLKDAHGATARSGEDAQLLSYLSWGVKIPTSYTCCISSIFLLPKVTYMPKDSLCISIVYWKKSKAHSFFYILVAAFSREWPSARFGMGCCSSRGVLSNLVVL